MSAAFDVIVSPTPTLQGKVIAQPSKNYTTRFLLAAALSTETTFVQRPANSDDSLALQNALCALGAKLTSDTNGILVRGFGQYPQHGMVLDPGNAGAVARFLMAISALTTQTTLVTHYPQSLGQRPQGELIQALKELGARITDNNCKLPLTVSGPIKGGEVSVSAERSSQFASALMFLGPLLPKGLDLHLTGDIKSHAPLQQTLHTLRIFGIHFWASPNLRRIQIPGRQTYRATEVTVPGDYPGSIALLTAAALLPGEVQLEGLLPNDLQGEREALNVLQEMGADLKQQGNKVTVRGGLPLRAVSRDGDCFTDAVQALCAAAAFAQGTTTWTNIATLRLKECDRISDTRHELSKLGLTVTETADSLSITGTTQLMGGITMDGHGDHRMIMLLSLLGLRSEAPLHITGAHHIAKSYPNFFEHLSSLGANLQLIFHSSAPK